MISLLTGLNPVTNKDGWWSYAVGPNKSIDTNKYFVICSNVIGGCLGSFGPSHKDPDTQKVFGTNFPVITINDMVNAQYNLIDTLVLINFFQLLEVLWVVCKFFNLLVIFLIKRKP